MTPTFFKTPDDLRAWFERHHAKEKELLVGFHKVDSGKPSVTWPQAVDEALCFGWIDGVRKSLGAESYMIRFTPRKPKSYWSSVNIKKAEAQVALGRMKPEGVAAFEARDASGKRSYSFESDPKELAPELMAILRKNKKAFEFHQGLPPGYRKTAAHWVMGAKSEETRLRRLQELIDSAARGERIRHLTPPQKRTGEAAKPRGKGILGASRPSKE